MCILYPTILSTIQYCYPLIHVINPNLNLAGAVRLHPLDVLLFVPGLPLLVARLLQGMDGFIGRVQS